MFYLLLFLCGCLTGVSAVLFGFGGGFVVVPLLYHLLQLGRAADDPLAQAAMQVAVATSTCVMIVNAALATYRHRRAGSLLRAYVWPLGAYIGIGAVLGAALVGLASGDFIRLAFVAYLAITILDCLLRRGFLSRAEERQARPLGVGETRLGGTLIGAIATFLGVGGSVMTIPLLRRCGLSMTQATSMANPLSLPVALGGTLTYLVLAGYQEQGLGRGFVGYIDLLAFATLAGGGWLGIRLATPLIGRIPDALHARVYVGLLAAVMLSMLAG
ncbi:TPA: sulfite exporter TauE/SafE family protein [Pseudomonas aeruginosa]|uniref:sulfite exporter TauE/SafE family protein n=1 Tax=Pseudomonas aeruginosa TaxID=287 RepID=UPI0022CD7565|nr:sulfite exporter TauE/SafE family protein [Pseudomonas aeruginosa]MBX5651374.1 sulfite exporter TauE/SafE family protein [Pseudomonas aeruginosa]MCZ9738143.1 sulfite exporter TauE/SafE family protein [Pseudomonas aeruginosa]HCF6138006.1 sulfite exporter TauE/SafE family protein [Pseudomonas aeruginosa]